MYGLLPRSFTYVRRSGLVKQLTTGFCDDHRLILYVYLSDATVRLLPVPSILIGSGCLARRSKIYVVANHNVDMITVPLVLYRFLQSMIEILICITLPPV